MAAHSWQLDEDTILERLLGEAERFDFFQAVRLLEMSRCGDFAADKSGDQSQKFPAQSACTPVGEGCEPEMEPIHFNAHVGFDFPATEVRKLFWPARSSLQVPHMVTNFFGLAGATGPLPTPLTELVISRLRENDSGLSDFLDIFNHRLISLLYRIRKVHRVALSSQSPEATSAARYVYSVLGLGTAGLRGRMQHAGVKDRSLLPYAGLLSQRPRSAIGLQQLLSEHFHVTVKIKQFCGAWQEIEPDDRTYLGKGGRNQALGQTTVLGSKVWDQQGHMLLVVGPLSWERFQHFLPDAFGAEDCYRPIRELARFYSGEEFQFRLRLKIREIETPGLRLGAAKLGWTAWLKARPELRPRQPSVKLVSMTAPGVCQVDISGAASVS
jgi:type VI secretion system protein ImpH